MTKKKPTPITKRLTTTTLINHVAADLGTLPDEVRPTVMATFDAIARANASGHDVAITNFVTFVSHQVKRRTVRNPQTGEAIPVPAHRVVRLRVSGHLADAVRRRDRRVTIRKAAKGTKTLPTTPSEE
ncbi:HU family DNA-binding protein [Streptomyces sp. NPDC005648]|uniref:HU family DNA-binding protein n=1 Tax=Streptomyces sp. NPDC005648 TaxID=3157044 RepID=UPI0033BB495B